MKPSGAIFAFLLGGIAIAICSGTVKLTLILTFFLVFLIVVAVLAAMFRDRSETAAQAPGAPPKPHGSRERL
jgi:membrane protein implicated in regulation of membrane protease activity